MNKTDKCESTREYCFIQTVCDCEPPENINECCHMTAEIQVEITESRQNEWTVCLFTFYVSFAFQPVYRQKWRHDRKEGADSMIHGQHVTHTWLVNEPPSHFYETKRNHTAAALNEERRMKVTRDTIDNNTAEFLMNIYIVYNLIVQ